MTRRTKIWLAVATVLAVINIGGAAFAFAEKELGHTLLHVAIAVAGGAWIWALLSRSRQQAVAGPGDPRARIEYLQQSVDAMALELERLGEAQRFQEKLRAQPKDDQS